MPRLPLLLSAALVTCTLTACDLSDRSATPKLPPSDLAQMGSIRYAPPASATPLTPDERAASLQAGVDAMTAISQSINRLEASEWEEADRRLQAALSTLEGPALADARQIAGAAMIRVWLPNAPDTPEARAVAARYVDLLVGERSPEAQTVLDGLDRVGDHWDAERTADAASAAADAVQPVIDREREKATARRSASPDTPETLGPRAGLSDLEEAQAELLRIAALR